MSSSNSDFDFGNKPIRGIRDPKYIGSYKFVNINCDQIINTGGEEFDIIKEQEEQEEDELKKLLKEISERLNKLEEVITNK